MRAQARPTYCSLEKAEKLSALGTAHTSKTELLKVFPLPTGHNTA